MSGSSGGSTSNTTATPWSGVQPYLNDLYSNATTAWNNGTLAPMQNTGQVATWGADMNNAYSQALSGGDNATNYDTALASGNLAQSGNLGANTLASNEAGQYAGLTGQAMQNIATGNAGNSGNTALEAIANGGAGGYGTNAALAGIANGNAAYYGNQAMSNMANGQFTGAGAGTLSGIANGNYGAAQPLTQFANGNFAGNANTAQLAATAAGQYLDPNNATNQAAINAALQPTVQNYQQAVLPGLLSTFSANGRLGSGANMSAIQQSESQLGQTLGNTSATMAQQQYNQNMTNMLNSGTTLAGIQSSTGQGLLGAQQGAAGTLTGAQGAAQQSLLGGQVTAGNSMLGAQNSAAQSLLGGQVAAGASLGQTTNQAASNLGALQGNALSALPGISSGNLNVAGLQQQYNQNIVNATNAQQNYINQLPYESLQNMEGILSGIQIPASSSTTTSQNPNVVGTALGGAATGAAIGSVVPGVGTAIGAGVGGLAGLLGGLL